MGVTSHSDLYGVLQPWGFAFFLEIKKPGEKPTEAQFAFLEEVEGACAFADWTDAFEDAAQILSEWEKDVALRMER